MKADLDNQRLANGVLDEKTHKQITKKRATLRARGQARYAALGPLTFKKVDHSLTDPQQSHDDAVAPSATVSSTGHDKGDAEQNASSRPQPVGTAHDPAVVSNASYRTRRGKELLELAATRTNGELAVLLDIAKSNVGRGIYKAAVAVAGTSDRSAEEVVAMLDSKRLENGVINQQEFDAISKKRANTRRRYRAKVTAPQRQQQPDQAKSAECATAIQDSASCKLAFNLGRRCEHAFCINLEADIARAGPQLQQAKQQQQQQATPGESAPSTQDFASCKLAFNLGRRCEHAFCINIEADIARDSKPQQSTWLQTVLL